MITCYFNTRDIVKSLTGLLFKSLLRLDYSDFDELSLRSEFTSPV